MISPSSSWWIFPDANWPVFFSCTNWCAVGVSSQPEQPIQKTPQIIFYPLIHFPLICSRLDLPESELHWMRENLAPVTHSPAGDLRLDFGHSDWPSRELDSSQGIATQWVGSGHPVRAVRGKGMVLQIKKDTYSLQRLTVSSLGVVLGMLSNSVISYR